MYTPLPSSTALAVPVHAGVIDVASGKYVIWALVMPTVANAKRETSLVNMMMMLYREVYHKN
jgi:hypothetical protein